MSTGQTIAGLAALGVAAQVFITSLLPDPPPIEVHSLTYQNGIVHQDRTVNSDVPFFYSKWQAQVVYASSGVAVEGCTGYRAWNYQYGRTVDDKPLAEWVNAPGCTLSPGRYRLAASWFFGDAREFYRSEVFEVTE